VAGELLGCDVDVEALEGEGSIGFSAIQDEVGRGNRVTQAT
jgi:hypothetical protein